MTRAVFALLGLWSGCGRTPLSPLDDIAAGSAPSIASGGRPDTGGLPGTGGTRPATGGTVSGGGIFLPSGGQPLTGGTADLCVDQSRAWSTLPDDCRDHLCQCGVGPSCGPECWAYLGCVVSHCERLDPLCAINACGVPSPELLQRLPGSGSRRACGDLTAHCNELPMIGCGDGVIGLDEECDPVAPLQPSCTDAGLDTGFAFCTWECRVDFSGCGPSRSVCGNGVVEAGETCDPAAPLPQTCAVVGLPGIPSCTPECTLDISACFGSENCGNGQLDPGEECDGMAATEPGCGCLPNCRLDRDSCLPQTDCGNGLRDPSEACDGADLGGLSCSAFGLRGTLACTPDCALDVNRCTTDPDQPETCATCGLTRCTRQIDACLGDPNCPAGVACMAERCGAEADTACTLSCFGNPESAVRALNVFTCTASSCGEQCLTQPLVPL